MIRSVLTALFFLVACHVVAMQKPARGELGGYAKDGTLAKRVARSREIGNHRADPALVKRALDRLSGAEDGLEVNAPLPNWQGMPTTGTNEMLVFLIDFPDHPHSNTSADIQSKLFGAGNPADYPQESLREFYRRSSYGQLTLDGNVLGWYRMAHERSWYTTEYGDGNEANLKIIEEVVDHYDASHDYARYDNDGDGRIDYCAVIWAGPDTGWSDFWWGYQWSLYSGDLTRDGVRFYDFSWQWEARPVGGVFTPAVIIHETGHALGLPDYYDYDDSVGPDGGLGGLDVMDAGMGDHNAFSKFMLDWLTPTVVNSGSHTLTLRASAQYPDAVTIASGYSGSSPYDEYFLVENRQRVENDAGSLSDGMLIWHVDATPTRRGDDFEYDNSYTEHKLLRLVQADGLAEIESGDGVADAMDYYTSGRTLGPGTTPSSTRYDGDSSGARVSEISAAGMSMTALFGVNTVVPLTISAVPGLLEHRMDEGASGASQELMISANGGSLNYSISETNDWLTVSPPDGHSAGADNTHTVSFDASGLAPGVYDAALTIAAAGAVNSPLVVPVSMRVHGANLPPALDAPQLAWATGGSGVWWAQVSSSHDGVDAAQAGEITHNNYVWLATSVEGPGALTFWWKVSSEADYDLLQLHVDDVLQPGVLSGLVDWQYVSLYLGPGAHSVRWSYVKDFSLSSGDDSAWVDQVAWAPDTRDGDDDGARDWEEAIAGTIDTNAASVLKLSDLHQDPAQRIVVEWPSVTGRLYAVDRALSLAAGFTQLVSRIAATPPMNVFTDQVSGVSLAFYRVRAEIADNSVVLLDEAFSSGALPAGWSTVAYGDDAAVWGTDNPGERPNYTGGEGGFVIADSDYAGEVRTVTDLMSPVLDCTAFSEVRLEFHSDFTVYFTGLSGQEAPLAQVDIRLNGTDLTNVWLRAAEFSPGPVIESVDLSPIVAGQADVQVLFYYDAFYDWWWQLDDIRVIARPAP